MTKQEVGEVQSSSDTFSLKYVIVVFSTFLYWRDSQSGKKLLVRLNVNTWWGYSVAVCLIISRPATQEKLNSFYPLLNWLGRITKILTNKREKFSDYM